MYQNTILENRDIFKTPNVAKRRTDDEKRAFKPI